MQTKESLINLLKVIESQLNNWWNEHKDNVEDFDYTQIVWAIGNLINDIRRIFNNH